MILVLIGAGLIKCIQISRRPTTSTLCVSSLTLFLAACLFSGVFTQMEQTRLRAALFAIGLTILHVASFVLAIIGLIEYRQKSDRYLQGRGQAIWGLLLSSTALLFICFTFVTTLLEQDRVINEIAAAEEKESIQSDGGAQRFEDLNFQFSTPDRSWVALSVERINPVASLAFVRKKPEVWFMVIAEKFGAENAFGNEALAEVAEANLRAGASQVRISKKRGEQVAGLDGIRFEADANVDGRSLSYSNWSATYNGFAYQLVAFSQSMNRQSLHEAALELCGKFRLIDPGRVAHAEGVDALGKYVSKPWGYRVDFSADSGWVAAPRDTFEVQAADMIGIKTVEGYQVSFGVIPIELPTPDVNAAETLAVMAASLFNMGNKSRLRQQVVEYDGIWFKGSEVAGTQRSSRAQFGYRMRLIVQNQRAYLMAGWWPPECGSADRVVQKMLDTSGFMSPQGTIDRPGETRSHAVALVLNELGINAYSKGDYLQAIAYFEAALENRNDPQMVENLVDAYFEVKKYREAESKLDGYLENLPDNFALRSLKAALCQHREDFDSARTVYEKLFLDGYDDEEELLTYLNLAAESEDYEAAVSVLQTFNEQYSSLKSLRWLAVMHGRKGDHERAIRQMSEIADANQDDLDTQITLGEVYETAGRFGESLAVCNKLLEKHPDEMNLYLLKGRNEFELERYSASQASFQKVIDRYPGNDEANQYSQYLSALLGRGDRKQISKPVLPVPIPAAVQMLVDRADTQVTTEGENEFDAVDIYKVVGISYGRDDHRKITTYRKIKANSQAGVEELSSLSMSFDPLFERLFVNRLAVFNAEGELVAEGAQDDYYVLDDSASAQASQDRRVYLPVPNLKPGYSVELTVTVEDTSVPDEFGYEEQFLVAANPLRLGAVYFQGDLADVASSSSKLDSELVDPELRIWYTQSPDVYESEALQVTLEDFLPYLRISDARRQWEDVGREYLIRIEPKLRSDPATIALAIKLTEGMTSRSKKIAVLTKYVQEECTYKALEFGIRSQVPNSAEQVRKNGYGDCKDHSVLLKQLLDAAGVPAQLALISSSSPVSMSLPSLSQFNHMIVYVPEEGAGSQSFFLDATEKYTTPMVPRSPSLVDKLALILDLGRPYLKRTPSYGSAFGKVEVERRVTMDHSPGLDVATISVDEQVTLNPYCSRGLRGYLQAYAPRDRRDAIRDLIAEVKKVRVNRLSVENLREPTKDLVLHLEYSVAKGLNHVGVANGDQRFVGVMPAVWERYVLEIEPDDLRVTPFEHKLKMVVLSRTNFQLPAGMQLKNAGKLVRRGESKFLRWQTQVEEKQDGFLFDASVTRNAGSYDPEEFDQYWQAVQASVSAAGGSVNIGAP
ncbi:MAG: tetratricopeptide repeat protein [Planctomycetota bacterium]